MMEEETVILAALSSLTPPQLSDLTYCILSQKLHHHHRLSSLLSSPSFSLTLHYLHSLSLSHKITLIAKHLLFSLYQLTRHFHSSPPCIGMKHRDLDATLLLFLLCDAHQHNPQLLKAPRSEWQGILSKLCSHAILIQSDVGVHYGGVLLPYIEMIIRCWRFVAAIGGRGEREVALAAAPSAVVGLARVEVRSGDCAICKEEMGQGRDVCELPCQHLFHWMCILPWLRKRNTCPCCRFQLPTENVFGEIKRLWNVLVKAGGGTHT